MAPWIQSPTSPEGAAMPKRRSITINLDHIDDDQYQDVALSLWMALRAVANPRRFEYEVIADDPNLDRSLNRRWAAYGDDLRWTR